MNHLVNHVKNSCLKSDNTLHVIGVISNSVRWHSRLRLFREWRERMLRSPNVKLYVVEGLYGDRLPECAPEPGQDYSYMNVKLTSEMWHKENLINIGVKNMFPANWKYICWSDCDVEFQDPNWALGAIHQLQHYNIIQPWSHAIDLDFHGGVSQTFNSFGYLCTNDKPMHHGNKPDGYAKYGHTGFAWCATRYWWENTGGLIDWCIIGSADHHIAWACIGKIQETIHSKVNSGYRAAAQAYERKTKWACGGVVGYLHGRITHFFHGHKVDRQYWNRWNIVIENNFDPMTDIAYDSQGVIQYIGNNKQKLEQLVMRYQRDRKEDSV